MHRRRSDSPGSPEIRHAPAAGSGRAAVQRRLSIQRWEPWKKLVTGIEMQCKGLAILAAAPFEYRDHGHNQAGLHEQ